MVEDKDRNNENEIITQNEDRNVIDNDPNKDKDKTRPSESTKYLKGGKSSPE